MDNLQRLLLRFVLVPVGYAVAVVVGTLVIVFGSWKLGDAAAHAETQVFAIFGFVFAAPVLLVMLLSLMWLPAAIGIVISEAFAIRSCIFHAGNGRCRRSSTIGTGGLSVPLPGSVSPPPVRISLTLC